MSTQQPIKLALFSQWSKNRQKDFIEKESEGVPINPPTMPEYLVYEDFAVEFSRDQLGRVKRLKVCNHVDAGKRLGYFLSLADTLGVNREN
jgi:hypothetical protein